MKDVCMPTTILLDTQAYDFVAANMRLKTLIADMQQDGRIELISTRIEADELDEIPPHRDIGQKSSVSSSKVGSAIFLLDISFLDEDRLGSDEVNAAFHHIENGKPKHTNDAMIGATAYSDADYLVTNDNRLIRRFSKLSGPCKVVKPDQLENLLNSLS